MTGRPPLVYLDTQDYSRFGSVVEGRGDAADEKLFLQLRAIAEAGDAIFACSMPVMSELLSYDEALPHISDAKAQAVESLCRGHALMYPSQLIGLEVSRVAQSEGLILEQPSLAVLSNDYGWYPDVGDMLIGLRDRVRTEGARQVAAIEGLNRAARRKAEKLIRTFDYRAALKAAIPEFADKYGLPHSAVERSIGEFLKDRMSSADASRRLFSAIAAPTNFVGVYFRGYEGDKDLPDWMASVGRDLETGFRKFQRTIADLPAPTPAQRSSLKRMIEENAAIMGATVVKGARDDAEKFGVPNDVLETMRGSPHLVGRVDAAVVIGRIFSGYMAQTVGLTGPPAKVEHSFGGDVMHALYLSHVDLWRADRRFGHLVANALQDRSGRIVRRLQDLPGRIEDEWRKRA